jgi:hypothetical protein
MYGVKGQKERWRMEWQGGPIIPVDAIISNEYLADLSVLFGHGGGDV